MGFVKTKTGVQAKVYEEESSDEEANIYLHYDYEYVDSEESDIGDEDDEIQLGEGEGAHGGLRDGPRGRRAVVDRERRPGAAEARAQNRVDRTPWSRALVSGRRRADHRRGSIALDGRGAGRDACAYRGRR